MKSQNSLRDNLHEVADPFFQEKKYFKMPPAVIFTLHAVLNMEYFI